MALKTLARIAARFTASCFTDGETESREATCLWAWDSG